MRGGYLRFQAQYLRRIRVPYWNDVPEDLRYQLSNSSNSGSEADITEAVCELYGLSKKERSALGGNGTGMARIWKDDD